jgi:hypothetical protein
MYLILDDEVRKSLIERSEGKESFNTSLLEHEEETEESNIYKGTKLHFKSPTAERRHVLYVGVGGDRTHACPLQKSRVWPGMPALTSRDHLF